MATTERYQAGDLSIDAGTRQVFRDGVEVPLPALSFDLLTALARAAPNVVSAEQLMDEVWAGRVVGPETVSQRIKLLRNALGDDSRQPRYVAPVQGRGYRLLAPVSRLDAFRARPAFPTRLHLAVLAGALLVAGAVGLHLAGSRDPTGLPASAGAGEPGASIAVLPFANRSDREDDAFFADGMHDDLLVQLSRIRGLRVISRSSVMGYRDSARSIPEIARELDVQTILEGAVQRAGKQVRITVQLIDGATDRHLWAETFDRALTIENVLAIQSEISRAVAEHLHITLLPAERDRLGRPGTVSLAAYESWLKGRQEMERFTEAGLNAAIGHMHDALASDPAFALAHVGLAETRLLQARFNFLDRDLAVELADPSLERALALEPALSEAFAVRGDALRRQGDAEGAESAYLKALSLNPNLAVAWLNYGWLLAEQERTGEQMDAWRRARQLDPRSPVHRVHGAFVELRTGNYDAAERELRTVLDRQPGFPIAHVILGELRAARGDQAGAVQHYRQALAANFQLPLAHAGLVESLIDLELDVEAGRAVEQAWTLIDEPAVGASRELLLGMSREPMTAAERNRLAGLVELMRAERPAQAALYSALLHLSDGRHGKALDELETAVPALAGPVEQLPFDGAGRQLVCTYAHALAAAGQTDRARAVAGWLIEQLATGTDFARYKHIDPIVCHSVLGKIDLALDRLREATADGVPAGWRYMQFRPELEALRAHPEFGEIVVAIRTRARQQADSLR